MCKYCLFFVCFLFVYINLSAQRKIESRVIQFKIQPKTTKNNTPEIQKEVVPELKDTVLVIENQEVNMVSGFKSDTVSYSGEKYFELEYSIDPQSNNLYKISDFKPGKYLPDSNGISASMALYFSKLFQEKIKNVIDKEDILIVRITGSADASSFRRIKYNNEFGDEVTGVYFYNDTEFEVNINTVKNITSNAELAFLRILSVKQLIESSFKNLTNTVIYENIVVISDKKGDNYRNVSIRFLIRKKLQ